MKAASKPGAGQHRRELVGEILLPQLHHRQVHRQPHPPAALVPQPALAAGGLQHQLADRDDQAGLLGHRDELARRDIAPVGVAPAGQHLEGADLAGAEIDLRLEERLQLVAVDRLVQLPLQAHALQRRLAHRRGVHLDAAAAALLGPPQRQVGVHHQRPAVAAVVGEAGHAHAGGQPHLVPVQQHRPVQRRQHLVRHPRPGLGRVHRRHQRHELVAAQAGHRVRSPQAGLHAGGHLAQQLVAGLVPQGIVHVLEPVEVDQHHRQRLPLAPGVGDLHVQPVLQHRSAGQRGQGIVGGQELRRPLGGLPPGALAAQAIAQGADAGATQRVRQPGTAPTAPAPGPAPRWRRSARTITLTAATAADITSPARSPAGRARGDHHRQAQAEDRVLVRALQERHRQAVGHQHRDRGQAFGSAGHRPARSGRWMAGGDRS